jgi:acetyltransferase-like isoleucine patch superfamily enzyme
VNTTTATPEQAMRTATVDMIRRALKLARNKRRSVFISKTARGKAFDLETLDPDHPDGAKALNAFLTPVARHYTFSGLGAPEEPNAINWRLINLPLWRRITVLLLVAISFVMKGTPLKNRLYRLMGVNIGRNVEIMQLVWLDHFRPELIFIGDNTLLGAYTRVTVHAYEGSGRFRYGLVEIGSNCTIGAGTGIGPILIEDDVRTLPGTTLSPYLVRARKGSVIGYNPPPVKLPEAPVQENPDATSRGETTG